ncbi:hypothetical protein [Streptomyces sp. 2131.1]|nr:hypothetical protein [Streptomyces sp. 2131.1]
MIDTATNTVTTTIAGLTGPYGLAFKPAPPPRTSTSTSPPSRTWAS